MHGKTVGTSGTDKKPDRGSDVPRGEPHETREPASLVRSSRFPSQQAGGARCKVWSGTGDYLHVPTSKGVLKLLLFVAAQQAVVIRDVTVIDGTGNAPRAAQTVVVQDGRIAAVGPSSSVRHPSGARVIPGAGKFLLPGFIDSHAHVAFGPVTMEKGPTGAPAMRMSYDHAASREMLSTLLAFGVTSVRNPSGPTREAVALRDSVERGELLGPRYRTAGEVIDLIAAENLTIAAKTPEEVRAAVARQAAAGVDYVKLYASLSQPLMKAGIDEARARGVKSLTHALMTTWTEAAQAGIDGIVHVIPGSPKLLPAARRSDYTPWFKGTQFMIMWFKYVDLASPEIRDMTDAIVARRVPLDLTLVTVDAMARGNQEAITRNPDLRYAPPSLERNWRHDFTLSQGWSPDDYTQAAAQWPAVERFVKHLYDAGVTLLVGTDTPNPWVAPGISFHREMELYVRAGIPPSAVLRMATLEGAKALGLDAEIGTVAVGKRADLVLLTANPMADITNSRRIESVMVGGTLHRPQELLPPRLRDGAR